MTADKQIRDGIGKLKSGGDAVRMTIPRREQPAYLHQRIYRLAREKGFDVSVRLLGNYVHIYRKHEMGGR